MPGVRLVPATIVDREAIELVGDEPVATGAPTPRVKTEKPVKQSKAELEDRARALDAEVERLTAGSPESRMSTSAEF